MFAFWDVSTTVNVGAFRGKTFIICKPILVVFVVRMKNCLKIWQKGEFNSTILVIYSFDNNLFTVLILFLCLFVCSGLEDDTLFGQLLGCRLLSTLVISLKSISQAGGQAGCQ